MSSAPLYDHPQLSVFLQSIWKASWYADSQVEYSEITPYAFASYTTFYQTSSKNQDMASMSSNFFGMAKMRTLVWDILDLVDLCYRFCLTQPQVHPDRKLCNPWPYHISRFAGTQGALCLIVLWILPALYPGRTEWIVHLVQTLSKPWYGQS